VGTSHLCVTDLHNRVLGVVTRRDLLSLRSARRIQRNRQRARFGLTQRSSLRKTNNNNNNNDGGASPQISPAGGSGGGGVAPSSPSQSAGSDNGVGVGVGMGLGQSQSRGRGGSGTYATIPLSSSSLSGSNDSFTDIPLAATNSTANNNGSNIAPSSSSSPWPVYTSTMNPILADNAYPDEMDDDATSSATAATIGSGHGHSVELQDMTNTHQRFGGGVDG
jgi:hypothetical protein